MNRAIAQAGICSRRQADELIAAGRVKVNGEVVGDMGRKVSEDDVVEVDGKPIQSERKVVVVMNKPKGLLSTMSDPHGRPTVMEAMPKLPVTVKPVGRLDKDTEGLLLFTNDGELAARLTHARYGIEKEYEALVVGVPDEAALQRIRKGAFIEGRRARPVLVEVLGQPNPDRTMLKLILHEGRKREVRVLCENAGHEVDKLRRVRFGPLTVKGMRSGEVRLLGQKDVDRLRKMVGLGVS